MFRIYCNSVRRNTGVHYVIVTIIFVCILKIVLDIFFPKRPMDAEILVLTALMILAVLVVSAVLCSVFVHYAYAKDYIDEHSFAKDCIDGRGPVSLAEAWEKTASMVDCGDEILDD